MPFGTASARLRKNIMFHLAQKCAMTTCFRCARPIESAEEMSIEHKKNWLHSSEPSKLFFDIENIAFSHRDCNIKAGSQQLGRAKSTSGYKGVCAKRKSWRVVLSYKKQKFYSSVFHSPRDAALEYDRMAAQIIGKDAVTNKSLGLL